VLVWLSPWNWTATDWAGVQCLVLVAAAIVAWRQVREARRLREAQAEQARRLHEAQAEPFVVVDFEVEESQEIYIVISNIGRTMARDVRLKFAPELTSSLDSHGPGVVPPKELQPLSGTIPSLAPGKRIRVMFDLFHQRDPNVYPDVFDVEISFYAPALKREIGDKSVLDLGLYRNILHPMRRDVHDVHERLNELVKEARKWTAGGSGLRVLTPRRERARTAVTMDLHRARGGPLRRRFYTARARVRRLFV
jgi:hypothetical protein